MKINIISIEKSGQDEFFPIIENYKKMISKYGKIADIFIFNKKIAQAQNRDQRIAQKAYSDAFESHLCSYNVALHPEGKVLDSFEFSQLFEDKNEINLFIGGAYGLEDTFLIKCQKVVSLSKLTFSHKIAKVVLFEQIYRSFTIINKHPYHK